MNLKKLFVAISILFVGIANSNSTTIAEECQKRAMNAYDKGSSDAEKQKLGAVAASDCFKEMGDSLKKNGNDSSSSTNASLIGTIILLLGIGGFIVNKVLTKGDKPLSRVEIEKLRENLRDIYIANSRDLPPVKKYKERELEESEKMIALALSGNLPITSNSTKGAVEDSRKRLLEVEESTRNVVAASQKSLNAAIKVRDQITELFSEPPNDVNDKEEMEVRELMKTHLADAINNIEKHQRKLAEYKV